MKILKRLILFLGIVFLGIAILSVTLFIVVKHIKIKELVEHEIEQELGINITIQKLEFSPLMVLIRAEGVTIHNPPGFEEKELAYIPLIGIIWDPVKVLMRKNPDIYVVGLDLARLNVIKNREGKINIKELIPVKEEGVSRKDETPFSFDILVLSVGEVNYTEYSGTAKKTHKYTIGIKRRAFLNLKSEDEVIKLIIYNAIQNTEIVKLINLTVKPIFSNVTDTFNAAWGTAQTGAKGALEIASLPFKLLFGK
ncbi:MAG: AsmA family protein [Candidatus Omnitrophota bacterium]